VALGAIVTLMVVAYVYGFPAAAEWVARSAPPTVERRMGEEVLRVLDRAYLEPSALDQSERTAIAERFARAARQTAPAVTCRVEFRAAGDTVNAMALPGGIIILLDGLVEFAEDPDEVFAVLGHELGHVFHGHPFRDMLQSLGVGALAGLAWGDFSGVAAAAPAVVGWLRYSRDFEREADEFALRFLAENGLDGRPLHAFFERVGSLERELGVDEMPEFLSTHPNTAERLERARPDTGSEEADAREAGGSLDP
jgi:predicted Zn-dependent protease